MSPERIVLPGAPRIAVDWDMRPYMAQDAFMTITVQWANMRDHRSDTAAASLWVRRFIGGAKPGGIALDVACGRGRHLSECLDAGLRVVGVDRDVEAAAPLRGNPGLELIEADLESGAPPPFLGRQFDVVIVTNYLWRPLLTAIVDAVAEDGLLIYETFARGHERYGRPSNPDFLLKPGELLAAVRPRLTPIAYEHVHLEAPARIVERICAAGPGHRWLAEGGPA
jgi:SAM-dependent methyltransferase